MEMYGNLTVKALQIELKKRGGRSTGRKEELIQRLRDYDRNNNFIPEVVLKEEHDPVGREWPPDTGFKSVTNKSKTPALDIVDINEYFLSAYAEQEGRSRYSAVHRKGYSMMQGSFLIALIEAQDRTSWFYRGQVNSEYTKSLTYFCKVVINNEGLILESNCECVAGKGTRAVCKHVAVVCYAILKYIEHGIWQIRKTCTENHQKWHAPKKQKIELSPIKSQKLSFHIPQYGKQKKKMSSMCYDPRPIEFRNIPCFNDSVRNQIINYSATRKRPLGILGIFPPASILGLRNDHDYLERKVDTEMIFRRLQDMANNAASIEQRTRGQSENKEWFEMRSFLITASNVGTIVHMTERRNKDAFVDNLINPKIFKSQATSWGKKHEKTAILEYETNHHITVQPCGLIISQEHPFIGCTPDGLIAEKTVLEVKCPFSIRHSTITSNNLDYLVEINGELHLKETSNYYYQVQTQLFVTGREFCDFVIWTTVDFKCITVTKNERVIKQEIIPKVTDFYTNYVTSALVKKYYH